MLAFYFSIKIGFLALFAAFSFDDANVLPTSLLLVLKWKWTAVSVFFGTVVKKNFSLAVGCFVCLVAVFFVL